MLRDIAEFDATEAWRGDGALSMRDWLVARCHISRARARTLVDAAAKTRELPALSSALADGRLTLDVLAPLAAVATPRTDADLAKAAEHWTPRQARQFVAEVKGATDAEAAAQVQRRFVRFDDQRNLIWAQLTGDSYALVKSALVGRARRHDHPSANDPDYERFESRCADALVQICVEQGQGARGARAGTGASTGRPGGAAADQRSSTAHRPELDAGPRRRPHDHDRAHRPRSPPLRRWLRARLHPRCRPDLGRGRPSARLQRAHHALVRRAGWQPPSTRRSWSATPARPSGLRSAGATTAVAFPDAAAGTSPTSITSCGPPSRAPR